jgi:hypothetical protein
MPIAPYTLEQAEEDIAELRGQIELLSEAHSQVDGGVVPNTADPNGYTFYSAAGQPSYINDAGLTNELSGAQLANVTPVVVTQATAQTVASYFVPGGDSIPGSIYKITAFGFGTTGSTGASNVQTFNLSHGGVGGGAQSAGSSLFGISQAFRWWFEAYLVCITNGAGGTFFSYGLWSLAQSGSNILPTTVQAVAVPTGTISAFSVDTTTGETFRGQLNWAATTGSPTLTCVAGFGGKIA